MKTLAFTPVIFSPQVLAEAERPPKEFARFSLNALCELAGVPPRVTGGTTPEIALHAGVDHFTHSNRFYVGVGPRWKASRAKVLFVLEVLAHGFHDYAAREAICSQGLFHAPLKRGRPRLQAQPMTAKERMWKMRQTHLREAG